MVRVVSFLRRISTPLKAIEYIIAFLVLGSAFIALVEGLTDEPLIDSSSSFRLLVDQYNIVAWLFVVMAGVALADIVALIADPDKGYRYRSIATFVYTIGFLFVAILSFLTLGASTLLWVNDLALAAISATLYITIKASDKLDEYIY